MSTISKGISYISNLCNQTGLLTRALLKACTVLVITIGSVQTHADLIEFEDIVVTGNEINAASFVSGDYIFEGDAIWVVKNAGSCCVVGDGQHLDVFGDGPFSVTMRRTDGEPFHLDSFDFTNRNNFVPGDGLVLTVQFFYDSGVTLSGDVDFDQIADNFQRVAVNEQNLTSVSFISNDVWISLDNIRASELPLAVAEEVEGTAITLDVGADGSVWKIDVEEAADGVNISKWDDSENTWEQVRGNAAIIAVGPDGTPWIREVDGDLLQGNLAGDFYIDRTQLSGAWDVDVGRRGDVFYLGNEEVSTVYRWDFGSWTALEDAPGTIGRIAVDPSGNPWVTLVSGQIYRHDGNEWIQVPGIGYDIDIGGDGMVYHLGDPRDSNLDRPAWRTHYTDPSAWEFAGFNAREISVGPSGQVWYTNFERRIFSTDSSIVQISRNEPETAVPNGYLYYYNGIEPNPTTSVGFNNVGHYDSGGERIYTCLRIVSNGFPATFLGESEFDAVFSLNTAGDFGLLTFQLAKVFNENNVLTAEGEAPDCSGSVDLNTLEYNDHIDIDGSTYRVRFTLDDEANLVFRNASIVQVSD